jgi:23S rRNA (adenine2503-C2)-methyltransferase
MQTTDIKSLSKLQLEQFITVAGLPAFRAKQLLHWIYEKHAQSIEDITEFSKDLRERLSNKAYISNLAVLNRQVSVDGAEKILFGLQDGETIESVLILEADRVTLCISSQVGCAMGCKFCLTGAMGLKRNLKAHEIVDQIISASRIIKPQNITNIVLMGMGEPLANFDNVTEALWRITGLMKISPKRITLSTSGAAPKILDLPKKAPMVNLAISLNATTDEIRDSIMPVNKIYPLGVLLEACKKFPLPPRRRITFEYVMLKCVNDSDEDAIRLIKLLKGIPSKINLIPFNPFQGSQFQRPDDDRILKFQQILVDSRLTAIIRKSKGQDISAACGQLKAQHNT